MTGGWVADETYRATITARAADDEDGARRRATLIVTRHRHGPVAGIWLTFEGSIRATVVLSEDQVDELRVMLAAARETRS